MRIKKERNKWIIEYEEATKSYIPFQGSLLPTEFSADITDSEKNPRKRLREYLSSKIRKQRMNSDEFFADRVTHLFREVSSDFLEILDIWSPNTDAVKELGKLLEEGFTFISPESWTYLCMPSEWIHKKGILIDYYGKKKLADGPMEKKVNGLGRVNKLYAILENIELREDPIIRNIKYGSDRFPIDKRYRSTPLTEEGMQIWGFSQFFLNEGEYGRKAYNRYLEDLEELKQKFEAIRSLTLFTGLDIIADRYEIRKKINLQDPADNRKYDFWTSCPLVKTEFDIGIGINEITDEKVTKFAEVIVEYISQKN